MCKFVVRINKLDKYKINFIVIIIFHVHYSNSLISVFPNKDILIIYIFFIIIIHYH